MSSTPGHRSGTGIVLGLLIGMVLIVVVGALAFFQLQQISATVAQLTSDLAEERALANDVARQVLLAQFYANQFVGTQNQADVDRFDQEFAQLQELLRQADGQINDPQRLEMLNRIKLAVDEYRESFQEVVDLIRKRQRLQSEILRIQGGEIFKRLTALRVHVADLGDPVGFLAVGNAQSEFFVMRWNLATYFERGDEGYAAQFRANYRQLQDALLRLEDILQDPVQRQNVAGSLAAADAYFAAFETIQSDYVRQTSLLRSMLNELGPEISATASDMAASVGQEFQRQNQVLQTLVGRARFVLIFTTAVALVAGFLLGGVMLRRNTEREQAAEQLRKSEERYRTLFEDMPIGLYRSEPGGRLLDGNPALVEMSGYPSRKALLAVNVVQFYADPGERLRWQSFLEEQGTMHDFEVQFKRQDGELMWALNSAKAVGNAEGRISFYEGSIQDISQRKAADQALKEAQEQLARRERLATLGEMAGSIGHELRNPLAVMAAAVYYLQMILPDAGEEVDDTLETIINEVNKSNKIITDLLDFARVRTANREAFAAADLIDLVLTKCPPAPNIQVAVEIPAGLPDLFVDPQQIEQVQVNLITNAYQAVPEGGQLTIEAQANGHCVSLSTTDSGVGISPENMKKLFEPLFTTKERGVGLGLAICRNLVTANEGTIDVQSLSGQGSTFTLNLPTAKA